MNWYKQALFNYEGECSAWRPSFRSEGYSRTCHISKDVIVEVHATLMPAKYYRDRLARYMDVEQLEGHCYELSFSVNNQYAAWKGNRTPYSQKNNDLQFQIMSVVLNSLNEFYRSIQPVLVTFDSFPDDFTDNRVKLYNAMVSRFISSYGYVKMPIGAPDQFYLVKEDRLYGNSNENSAHEDDHIQNRSPKNLQQPALEPAL